MLDDKLKSCLPCGLHAPMRNYYFDGKLLVARDFIDEQEYHRGLRSLHNQMLHGSGTVCGLKLIQHPMENCRRENLVLEPGLALDCCGQELIVPERLLVPVAQMLAQDPDLRDQLTGEANLLIGLRRCDRGAEPMPVLLPGCGAGETAEFGRVREGVELVLWAEDPRAAEAAAIPQVPRFDWVHTMSFEAQSPKALHVNEVEQRLQVAVDNGAGGSHGYVFISDTNEQAQTHDLTALLEGPAELSDSASSRETGFVYFAGRGWEIGGETLDGIGLWRAGQVTSDARPLAVIPSETRAQRLAVSPTSGALFVLETAANRARLVSYGAEALAQWVAEGSSPGAAPPIQAALEFDHGFGAAAGPYHRGAAMIKVSGDGRFLAICCNIGAARERLYLIDIAAFNAGSMTQEEARARGLDLPGNARLMALDWSLDGSYIFLLSQRPAVGGTVALSRYGLTGDGNALERAGRGVELAGAALDLAVAPTESRAYILLQDPDGVGRMTTVDMERVVDQGGSDPLPVALSADALRIDGAARSMALMQNGRRLYLAAADGDESGPERGFVAVINITEADCGAKFLDPLEGCPACAEEDHRLPLALLPGYVAEEPLPMKDPDQAGEGEIAIDNLSRRTMVPSAATLRDVIACMLAQGVAEGPPGPRGNPGQAGRDGASVIGATVELGAPGSSPQATTRDTPAGLVLDLTLPAARDGEDGEDGEDGNDGAAGAGIDDARIDYVDGLDEPQVAIITQGRQRILDIDLPSPAAGGGLPATNPIIGLSWAHGAAHPAPDLMDILLGQGVAVAFEEMVDWTQFRPKGGPGPTMLAELQRRHRFDYGEVWVSLTSLDAVPISFEPGDVSDGLLRQWQPVPEALTTRGFALIGGGAFAELMNDFPFQPGEVLRLVFHADFVTDLRGRVVDGTHLGGKLPTGQGAPGDTFYSWFTVPGTDRRG